MIKCICEICIYLYIYIKKRTNSQRLGFPGARISGCSKCTWNRLRAMEWTGIFVWCRSSCIRGRSARGTDVKRRLHAPAEREHAHTVRPARLVALRPPGARAHHAAGPRAHIAPRVRGPRHVRGPGGDLFFVMRHYKSLLHRANAAEPKKIISRCVRAPAPALGNMYSADPEHSMPTVPLRPNDSPASPTSVLHTFLEVQRGPG